MRGYFPNRRVAGIELAARLADYRHLAGLLILALPRGGVPVAYEVARILGAEIDVLVVRKLGLPQQPELALGAIASGGACVLNESLIRAAGVTKEQLDTILQSERQELGRRERAYRGDLAPLEVHGRTVILVDDGMATGASMHAAVIALRSLQPARMVVAVPVAPPEAADEFLDVVDDFVCVESPRDFNAVGWWYRDFSQVEDHEVRTLLQEARSRTRATSA